MNRRRSVGRARFQIESLEQRELLTTVPLGELNAGIGVDDDAVGTGYIMYTQGVVHDPLGRFANAPPSTSNSNHLIAVRWNGSQWQYNNNKDWYAFNSVSTDRLLAEVDFDADSAQALLCQSGSVHGIAIGYADTPSSTDFLTFEANVWRDEFDLGEFTVRGTTFDDAWSVCGTHTTVSPDSGSSDFITNQRAVLLQGRFAAQTPNPTLVVSVGGTAYGLGSPLLTTNGLDWTLDLTGSNQLSTGTHAVIVTVNGAVVSTSTVVVDQSAPAVAINSITTDTGASDFITTDTRLQIFGTYENGSDLQVEVAGHRFDLKQPELTSVGSQWILDLGLLPLPGGTHTIVATAADLAGNITVAQRQLTIVTASIDSVDGDTGVAGDFTTSDGTVVVHGKYSAGIGATLSVNFNNGAAVYQVSSPELSVNDDRWTLDLTGTNLAHGTYPIAVTIDAGGGNQFVATQNLVITDDCFFADSYELFDENGNPISSMGQVLVDSLGNATVNVDLEARKVPVSPANEFWVDDVASNGNGSLGSPFNDIWKAFDAIDAIVPSITAATIHVAPGNYIWGYQQILGFDMNIIGSGPGDNPAIATIVRYDQTRGIDPGNPLVNRYTAQFRNGNNYIEGITFDGAGISDGNPATPDDARIVMDVRNANSLTIVNSEFKNAGSGGDGMNIVNTTTVLVYDSTAHHNDSDGFSYTSGSAGQPMEVLEISTHGYSNGLDGEWNSQGSTVHESVDIVRVGGLFEDNPTNISDVTSGDSWNVNVTAINALANVQGGQFLNFNISENGTAWIVGGDFSQGNNSPMAVNATPGAQIRQVSLFDTLDPISHIVTGSVVVDDGPLVPVAQPCVAMVSIDGISQDSGAADFVTFDQELTVRGTFVGSSLQVQVGATVYNLSSPQLTVDGTDWLLDLTQTRLAHGSYVVTATATDDASGVAVDTQMVTVDCDATGLALVDNPVLTAIGSQVFVDASGAGTVLLNHTARQVTSSHVFYVNENFDGNGTQGNPFQDIPDALSHIETMAYQDAVIYVAAGDYSWGDAIDPDLGSTFDASFSILGSGPGVTRILQGATDSAAGLFHEAGRSLYVEGVTFVGLGLLGTRNVNENSFDARNGKDLTFVRTEFRNSTDGDGLFVNNFDTVVLFESKAIDNESDGFSYTKPSDNGPSMYVLEVGVVAAANGKNGLSSSQGSTMHRDTQIVRVNSVYANNPTNIEDTGLTSWNVNLTLQKPTLFQPHAGGYVNMEVRGDKQEATHGTAWFISGSYDNGGVVHTHTTTANNGSPVHGTVRYSSLFDISGHQGAFSEDPPHAVVIGPANDSQLGAIPGPCDFVAYWDFEADSRDRAFVGAQVDNGNLTGANRVPGGVGTRTLRIGGAGDLMELATSPDINQNLPASKQKSVALWFFASNPAASSRQVIYQQGGAERGLNIYLQNGTLHAGGWNSGIGWSGTWLSHGGVVADQWNHVVFVLDVAQSQVRLYVNGGLAATGFGGTVGGHNVATLGGATLGSRYKLGSSFETSNSPNSFTGFVDDVRIYQRTITATEAILLGSETLSPPVDVFSDLVAYWDFESGNANDKAVEGVLDDDGLLLGAQVVGNAGEGVLQVSGDGDRLELMTSPDINQNFASKSIALWFYPQALSAAGRQVVYQQGGTARGMNIYVENGTLRAGAWNDSAGWTGTWVGGSNVIANAWNHIALVLDDASGSLSVYLNGSLSGTGFGDFMNGHNPATLGSATLGSRYFTVSGFENSSASNSFRGFIDDARIYSRPLSSMEVALLAANTLSEPVDVTSNLVAYWDFEGNSVADKATEGAVSDNGTLTGAGFVSAGLGAAALEFSGGGDIMELATSSDINATAAAKTISLWFFAQDLLASGRQVVYQQGGASRGMNIYLENGSLYAGAWNDSQGWTGTWLSKANIVADNWTHVALVLDSGASQVRMLVNGVVVGSGFATTMTGHNPATLGSATLGSRYKLAGGFETSNASNSYVGILDDVRVYSRALSNKDVAFLASASLSDPTP